MGKFIALVAVLSAPMLTSPLLAQYKPAEGNSSLDVRPSSDAEDLGRYLSRLASNPRNVDALIGAGETALKLDDPRAATGFFARAEDVSPNNGRVKAGLARAVLDLGNPTEAIRLFGQAVHYGVKDADIAADRGLAFDLMGETERAQRDYKLALDRTPSDPEILRRYAVSLGISGKWQEAEKVLDPLLRKSDKSAWRDRAFILAMNGQAKQARDITQVMMPKPLATAIQPFMDRMPGLTAAQRAAAVHFGNFPAGSVQSASALASNSKPDSALVPSGQPLGRTATAPSASAADKKEARRQKDKQVLPARPVRMAQAQSVPIPVAVPTSTPPTSNTRGSDNPASNRTNDFIGPPVSPTAERFPAKAPQSVVSTPAHPTSPPPPQAQEDER
ncbi:MAG: tetratricopeptide repeat protein, partial [Alphaproteobacteria bacterium]|nr:tetratricopeptide repeat protein [Alphaproteobacteria bacterium]